MVTSMTISNRVVVVIPNWNGRKSLKKCIDSLLGQSLKPQVIMVDNGSSDGSTGFVEQMYPEVKIIRHDRNEGYAGGVNPGLKRALESGADYVAPFNNDATADPRWLEALVDYLDKRHEVGIANCKVLSEDGGSIDTTGECYTVWGLPYPRGRGETSIDKYDSQTDVFAASGAASLYRVSMLSDIGLFDEDFFAYYEDVDLSFRAQLAGWKIAYVPKAVVYHELSATGKRIKGFFTYQTIKNYPWLLIKNVPARLLPTVAPRLMLAQALFIGRAVARGHSWYALKAIAVSMWKTPKKMAVRIRIQRNRKVTPDYIWSIMTHDLPPNAEKLRQLRSIWWKLKGKQPQ